MKKEGWKYKKLGEVCEIFGRIGFRGYTKADFVTHPKDGAITLSPSNIINGELDFSKCSYINWQKYHESPEIMLEVGDVVLVKTASIGKCALVRELPHETTLNPQFVVLKKLQINGAFFVYFLKSPKCQQIIQQFSAGAAIPTLSQKKLGTLAVPVPPLKEQEEIVAYLDGEFERIEKLKRNAEAALQHTKDLFQSTLKQLLTPKPNWEEKKLKDLATEFGRGKSKHRPRNDKKLFGGNYPFIQTGDIRNAFRYIVHHDETYNEKGLAQSKLWPSGTICITIAANIAETAVLTYPCCFPDSVIGLIPNNKKISSSNFILYLLQNYQSSLQNMGKGAAQDNINLGTFEKISFPIPPLAEQQAIVSRLDTLSEHCRKLEQNYRDTLTLCDDLKQALLREVFE